MGSGIATALADAGFAVILKEVSDEALQRGLGLIRAHYASAVQKGRLRPEELERRMALITPSLDYAQFARADLVIEAVFEDLDVKKRVFAELSEACGEDAILATNTSTLDIDAIAGATPRAERVIGVHFFSPAPIMRLVEVVRGAATSPETTAGCLALVKKLGKTAVLAGNCRGFIGNRMFEPYRREAQFLVEEGARVEEVDRALTAFGMAMGPLATCDLVGLDVMSSIRTVLRTLEPAGLRQPLIEDRLCTLGRLGQKTGAGWYRYGESRKGVPDDEVAELIRDAAHGAGLEPREVSEQEIVDRTLCALVNEGARILDEGAAQRASDIDVVYVTGYGFPAWRGGPMWYADRVGLDWVYQKIRGFESLHGGHWRPSPLLERLAREGGSFAALDRAQAET